MKGPSTLNCRAVFIHPRHGGGAMGGLICYAVAKEEIATHVFRRPRVAADLTAGRAPWGRAQWYVRPPPYSALSVT